jgi:hypothetical protein
MKPRHLEYFFAVGKLEAPDQLRHVNHQNEAYLSESATSTI